MFNTKNSKLETILQEHFYTKGNDKLLYIEYLKRFHCKSETERIIIERILLEAPNQASLVRQRAYFQNVLGKYLPPLGIVNSRKQKAEEIKQKIKEAKKDKLGLFDGLARFWKSL